MIYDQPLVLLTLIFAFVIILGTVIILNNRKEHKKEQEINEKLTEALSCRDGQPGKRLTFVQDESRHENSYEWNSAKPR